MNYNTSYLFAEWRCTACVKSCKRYNNAISLIANYCTLIKLNPAAANSRQTTTIFNDK